MLWRVPVRDDGNSPLFVNFLGTLSDPTQNQFFLLPDKLSLYHLCFGVGMALPFLLCGKIYMGIVLIVIHLAFSFLLFIVIRARVLSFLPYKGISSQRVITILEDAFEITCPCADHFLNAFPRLLGTLFPSPRFNSPTHWMGPVGRRSVFIKLAMACYFGTELRPTQLDRPRPNYTCLRRLIVFWGAPLYVSYGTLFVGTVLSDKICQDGSLPYFYSCLIWLILAIFFVLDQDNDAGVWCNINYDRLRILPFPLRNKSEYRLAFHSFKYGDHAGLIINFLIGSLFFAYCALLQFSSS